MHSKRISLLHGRCLNNFSAITERGGVNATISHAIENDFYLIENTGNDYCIFVKDKSIILILAIFNYQFRTKIDG